MYIFCTIIYKYNSESIHNLYKKLRAIKTLPILVIDIGTLSTLNCLQHTSPKLRMIEAVTYSSVPITTNKFSVSLAEFNEGLRKNLTK